MSRNVLDGGERWEFAEDEEGSTLVKLTAWRERPGLDGWLERIFPNRAWGVSIRKRLNHVQFAADRRAAGA